MSFYSLTDFLEPIHLAAITGDVDIKEGQMGRSLGMYEDEFPDLTNVDIVIAGCDDLRGDGNPADLAGVNKIRKEFYALYFWHKDIRIADIGNIKRGVVPSNCYFIFSNAISCIWGVI